LKGCFRGPPEQTWNPHFGGKAGAVLMDLAANAVIFIVILLLVALGTSGGCAIYFDPEVSSVDHVWYI